MEQNEEVYIEGMALVGSLTDTAVRLVNDYPDLPEEVIYFIKTIAEMFEYAEANVFNKPQFEKYSQELIEDL